jgi:predicted phosphoribosyltransferase
MIVPDKTSPVQVGREGLQGLLGLPHGQAQGLVIFAHGSGSGRLSPRNQHVAEGLRAAGLATLLLDLLTIGEEVDRANVFDIELLARRLRSAANWARQTAAVRDLPIGFFGASTGAGAALVAAAALGSGIGAVVSRGGRPDLAGAALSRVTAPTLLIVGGNDGPVIDLNKQALEELRGRKSLVIVPGAGHLFEEPGTLDDVIELAAAWFLDFLPVHTALPTEFPHFADRRAAARQLASALLRFKDDDPIVLALPRGGVPVGYEVAMALDAPLDVVLVRKIGVPGHEEYGLGAVVDGNDPQTVLNDDVVRLVKPPPGYIAEEQRRQLAEIERRRELYLHGRPSQSVKDRLVIVVDDGIATGGTVKAVLKALSRAGAAHVVLAVPVAPAEAVAELSHLADEVVCLASPTPFHAVGLHYRNFEQTSDDEVIELLDLAAERPSGRGRPDLLHVDR